MKSRSLLLLGVMLVSPAWSQEPATNTPVLTPQSFDRSNEAIRKILHDAATAQSPPAQLPEETPVEPRPVATFVYVPPEKAQPVKSPPTPRLPTAAPESDSLLSAVFGTLIEDLLDVEPPDDPGAGYWVTCQEHAPMQRAETCPGANHPAAPKKSR